MKQPETATVGSGPVPGIDSTRSIGEILVAAGRLDSIGATKIAVLQEEQGVRFGEAAVRLKLLKPSDIEFALSRQFAYPYLTPGKTRLTESLVCAFQPSGSTSEQLRSLRTKIATIQGDLSMIPRTLAVVSHGRSEGRSFIAANLAIVFAQVGERVLLVDSDLRRPVQHSLFGVDNRIGLSNVLLGRANIGCATRIPEFYDLSVLTAGSQAPNPQELLSWPSLPAMLKEACGEFDRVILDTPAAELSADAHMIAARAVSTLLVARANMTDANALTRLRSSLRESGANVLGAILNDA